MAAAVLAKRGEANRHAASDARRTHARTIAHGDAPRSPKRILALQRQAGNRAVARLVATPSRAVARCAGACSCGATCADTGDKEGRFADEQAALRTAVLARRGTAAAVLARATDCKRPATTRNGAGHIAATDAAEYESVLGVIGRDAWKLTNFDIDKHFVKKEHEDEIRSVIVPKLQDIFAKDPDAKVAVIGEASTTASSDHNNRLSKRRAECVMKLLQEMLPNNKVFTEHFTGKELAKIRGGIPKDNTESDDDRRVAIVPAYKDPVIPDPTKPCPDPVKKRASNQFKVRIACNSPNSIAVNIGDVSNPQEPTYRRFKWVASAAADRCKIKAASDPDAFNIASTHLRLAIDKPDEVNAPSSFTGDATINPKLKSITAAGGRFFVGASGAWTPASCATRDEDRPGFLVPVSKVECGDVPMPARGPTCDKDTEPCSPEEKLEPATKFGATILRFSHEVPLDTLKKRISKYLPGPLKWLLNLITLDGTEALVQIGSLDGAAPRRTRNFLFIGLQWSGPGGLDGQAGVDKESTSTKPLRLVTKSPDDATSPSDFDSDIWALPPSPAKLVIPGGHTATEELHVGDMTFDFKGVNCHHGGSQTFRGMFTGVSAVDCHDIGPLVEHEPDRNCPKEDCPKETRLQGHTRYTFKVGRATLASLAGLPAVMRDKLDRFGCELVAANVNIGTTGESAIHRKFVFIGRKGGLRRTPGRQPCDFAVGKGDITKHFLLDRHLSDSEPDDILDNSDLAGLAKLDDKGELKIQPINKNFVPYTLKLPGAYQKSIVCRIRGAEGILAPIDAVQCGEAPVPAHDTTVDRTQLDDCRGYRNRNPIVLRELLRLRLGVYDSQLRALPLNPDPSRQRAGLFYHKPLNTLLGKDGETIRPAVFVGRNQFGEVVMTFVDMQIISARKIGRRFKVMVRFIGDPCTFDPYGTPVFVQPKNCVETLPQKGMETELMDPTDPNNRPKLEPKDDEEVRTAQHDAPPAGDPVPIG